MLVEVNSRSKYNIINKDDTILINIENIVFIMIHSKMYYMFVFLYSL